MRIKTFRAFSAILVAVPLVLQSCATYELKLRHTEIPVSFTNEIEAGEKKRFFRIEKKLTWVGFDLMNTQQLDLDLALEKELPGAKRIINLRIKTMEDMADSTIRFLGTLIQYLLVADRSLVSRRTVIIEGEAVE